MRAREFVTESRVGSIQDDVARALPATYVLTKLENQDPYKQYRFGVAIAGAKGAKQRAEDGVPPFDGKESVFGENEIVVSYDPGVEVYIKDALQAMGMPASDAVRIGTDKSEEMPEVVKVSPVKPFKGYGR